MNNPHEHKGAGKMSDQFVAAAGIVRSLIVAAVLAVVLLPAVLSVTTAAIV
jgi:hypothetical protein